MEFLSSPECGAHIFTQCILSVRGGIKMIFRFSFVGLVVEKIIFSKKYGGCKYISWRMWKVYGGCENFLEDLTFFVQSHKKKTLSIKFVKIQTSKITVNFKQISKNINYVTI